MAYNRQASINHSRERVMTSRSTHFAITPALCMGLFLTLSCASLHPDYEEPTVTLSSFRALPSEGMAPAFEIGLRILNPNRRPLNIEGIMYTISLQGHDLVKGVGKDFPVIEGYSERAITLQGSANLLAGIRLFGDLMRDSSETLEYEFRARLDLGGIYPSLRMEESGTFRLDGGRGETGR